MRVSFVAHIFFEMKLNFWMSQNALLYALEITMQMFAIFKFLGVFLLVFLICNVQTCISTRHGSTLFPRKGFNKMTFNWEAWIVFTWRSIGSKYLVLLGSALLWCPPWHWRSLLPMRCGNPLPWNSKYSFILIPFDLFWIYVELYG